MDTLPIRIKLTDCDGVVYEASGVDLEVAIRVLRRVIPAREDSPGTRLCPGNAEPPQHHQPSLRARLRGEDRP